MVARKKGAAVITEGAAQAILRRGAALELAPDEEKVMRMRLGASPPRAETLERLGCGVAELEIELLSYEIEAFLKLRQRRARVTRRQLAPAPSRVKEKIVRALRKKS
jgi:DNA-directed RNA polymerase sigma subunit (sigma70/sigma32)